MPPKEKLTKQDIVSGAVELIRRKGIKALNARALAEELDCSTMPLFRNFQGMEEIRRAAMERIGEIYSAYIQRGAEQELPFKAMGMEYIRFAKEEPNFFRLMFMTDPRSLETPPLEDHTRHQVVDIASHASGLDPEKVGRLYQEMWVFVHGIATLIITGVMEFREDEISTMLSDVFLGVKWKLNQSKEETTI